MTGSVLPRKLLAQLLRDAFAAELLRSSGLSVAALVVPWPILQDRRVWLDSACAAHWMPAMALC